MLSFEFFSTTLEFRIATSSKRLLPIERQKCHNLELMLRMLKPNDIDRVVFIPVIHVDEESVNRVRQKIHDIRPDVVAAELDRERYQQLISKGDAQPEEPQSSGNIAIDFLSQIAILEQQLGDMTGTQAGNEMLAAIEAGRAVGSKIALIDRPFQETSTALMRIPLDEIYRLMHALNDATDVIEGTSQDFIVSLRDGEMVDSLLEEFEREFPAICDVLIHQRNQYIANALFSILNDVDGLIVAVLGAGHIKGVKSQLTKLLIQSAGQ